MDDIAPTKSRLRPKIRLSVQESTLRLKAVEQAYANNRIEGIFSGPETKPIFDAYVRGEIEAQDIVPRLKLLYKVP
jgi:hypothetical protein